jgi:hypothetical protein
MIKTTQGHIVLSESGKPLSKPNLSEAQAKKRLAQVEAFKHMKAKGHVSKKKCD